MDRIWVQLTGIVKVTVKLNVYFLGAWSRPVWSRFNVAATPQLRDAPPKHSRGLEITQTAEPAQFKTGLVGFRFVPRRSAPSSRSHVARPCQICCRTPLLTEISCRSFDHFPPRYSLPPLPHPTPPGPQLNIFFWNGGKRFVSIY
jgi:hypothetical protein